MSSPSPGATLQRLVLVTGPSGAGRSTAIKALEDLGYEAIDNLPFRLLERLFSGPAMERPIALGLDVRNRDFSQGAIVDAIHLLERTDGVVPELLYLDCRPDVLLRRYSETRRRHPMAPEESPLEGIAQERDLLGPVRARADVLIDTSNLTPHGLRGEIERWFALQSGERLGLTVQSFSYKRGLPAGADLVFDCRFLRNPHWEPALRSMNGLDADVAAYVAQDPRFGAFFSKLTDMVDMLLPAYLEEGRAHLSIAFGCTGGQHRSVFTAERLAAALAQQGWQVSIRHRELDRQNTLNRADASLAKPKDGQA